MILSVEIISGDLPTKKGYLLTNRRLVTPGFIVKKWHLNKKTVESVELLSDRFLNSVGTERTLFGVGEALADLTTAGLSGVGKGQLTTLFKITFRDGKTATCHGTAQDFKTVTKWSNK